MKYEFKSTVGKQESSLMWNYRILVPDKIVQKFKNTDKRIVCNINNSDDLHCALHSNGDGTYYIMTNKQFRKKNNLNSGDQVNVILWKDESRYGMAVPDFFEELCFQDPVASTIFHDLTAGKQRSLLHIILKVKSEEKQLEKALTIFEYLKDFNGEIDYKTLNEALKNNRFKKF